MALASHVTFARDFAATEGWVKASERPYRQELCLNGSWRFQPVAVPRGGGTPPILPSPTKEGWSATPIRIPSPWNVNRWTVQGRGDRDSQPYHTDSVYFPSYPRAWDDAEMGWLRRSFRVPTSWGARRVRLRFEAVAGDAQVYVNGRKVGEDFDSFLPFEIDVTDALRPGENELRVGVRAARLYNGQNARYAAFRAPYPPGSTLDHVVGIWQDVYLLGVPAVRAEDTFVRPEVGKDRLSADITLRNDTGQARTVRVGGTIRPWVNLAGRDVLSAPEPKSRLGAPVLKVMMRVVTVPPHGSAKIALEAKAAGRLKLWSPDHPNLYDLAVDVAEAGKPLDHRSTRFGWREFKIVGKDLHLNGENIRLYGDLLHPFGPFVGSRRYAWSWYRMIKDMGGNAVRPHAQPMPRHYLDLADEMGICVLDETALFGSSIQIDWASPAAWPRIDDHYDRLVLRDRNHPAVFGWSCGNELFATLLKVPPAEQPPFYERLKAYAQRSYRLDPTRDWVSCDGDEDLRGGVPVWSKHYGHGGRTLPAVAKPRMVGESGGTYYAKPGQLAEFNGERAYESYRGRSEALAIDAYANVRAAKKDGLAYFSASETAWFGIEHLPLGYRDRTRSPSLSDGVFFGPFREGQPGVQPERIPPFAMTFNPGLDPDLPLYKPLPMFEAMRAAIADKPSPWSHRTESPKRTHPKAAPTFDHVVFAGNRGGALYRRFDALGVPFGEEGGLMVVDGDALDDATRFKPVFDAFLDKGGTVLVALRTADDAKGLNALLPASVQIAPRRATMLLPSTDPRVGGFGLPNLYFAENAVDAAIAERGLGGEFVQKGRVLLSESDADWSIFNDRSEEEKCSNFLVYEGLAKPSGAALVEMPVGAGRVLLSTVNYVPDSLAHAKLWRQLLTNFGVRMGEPRNAWALPTALIDGPPHLWRFTTTKPSEGWEEPLFRDADWSRGPGGFGGDVPGGRPHTPWNTEDIWLRSSFKLDAVTPELRLHVYHDEDVEVYVNGALVYRAAGHVTEYQTAPLPVAAVRTGENSIAVHCHQTAGGQYIDVGVSLGPTPVRAAPREHDLLRDGPLKP